MIALKRVGLSLLLGGMGIELLAVMWLIIFAVTGGAAPTPIAPGDPPVPALVLLVVGMAAIAPGYVMAIVYRTRRERDVAGRVADGRGDVGASVASAIGTAYSTQFAPYRRRMLIATTVGVPVMVIGPLCCFAAGAGLVPGLVVCAAGLGLWAWGILGFASRGRVVQRDLIAAGYPVRGSAPFQNAWSLAAWAEINHLTPEMVAKAAARRHD